MARLVESLEDWDAVRLGALGPLDAKASRVLQRKRAAFLISAVEKYGLPRAEVFALFLLHTSFDDELREWVQQLARDKQLGETLGGMPTVREELLRRGLKIAAYPEREERAGDVLRGLGRAGRDALSSTEVSAGARYVEFSAKRAQLPPPYQEALDAVERALMAGHFSPGNVVRGGFDHLTFGVPMGFFHLAAGTAQGAVSLAKGRYEQATRELAPAALMVALYAGGKGIRALRAERLDVEALKAAVGRLEEQLGVNATRELLRQLRASREGALLAAEWGEAGALALYEARGNPAKAQALLAEASREPQGAARSGGTAALPKDFAGVPPEVLEARLAQIEWEATGPRLSRDVSFLKQHPPERDAPPGAEGHPLWTEYVSYREARLAELEQSVPAKGPLRWEGYLDLRGQFIRGLLFERAMVALLRADAALPRAQRQWLRDFEQPRIETHVGMTKADLRFADVLVIETKPPSGQSPRMETFSFKSRDMRQFGEEAMKAQMGADARAALRYYGETVNVRRPGLEGLARIRRVRLIYEGGALKPRDTDTLKVVLTELRNGVEGVEIQIQ
ncbi:hypothetical protein D7X55_06990 [Corallococcus sp. AB049A]|uniref:Uncharacterized protein n=1 Tax=Corallococcus interemptor TaxID=2316720 RepID=A0A3A8QPA9_9BACT|nr:MULTISPECIES: hypothetical protein [Corallococcus]RKH70503.1 hypothetical protein D7X96_11550 [Corallococcus interemptor]RKI72672.1 hypothetical protein D7X55_06990 [Corallococcus sp. AB049A]